MQVGFFFWPYTPELCERLAQRADRYGYAMIGIADTPGNAMDPWVSAAIVARSCGRARVAICVTNLLSRHPAVSAAAIASLDRLANGRAVLGIGAGNSGTKNVGLAKSRPHELADGVTFIKTLLRGEPATLAGATAHLPWVKRAPPVFLAASHPKPLQVAGRTAEGVFVNYGLGADDIRESRVPIVAGAKAARRAADDPEIWQVAALDCNDDRDLARNKVGAMLAFLAGYVIGDKRLERRGVPEAFARAAPPIACLSQHAPWRRRHQARTGARTFRLSLAAACDLRQSAGLPRAGARRQVRRRRAIDAHREPRIRPRAHCRTVRRTCASPAITSVMASIHRDVLVGLVPDRLDRGGEDRLQSSPTLSPMPNGRPLSGANGAVEFASSAIAFRGIDYSGTVGMIRFRSVSPMRPAAVSGNQGRNRLKAAVLRFQC
jgi:alkanesulfonate monooxygenase SsuD/methylene tetrahydromethanopterin reductase-like flavin-dependent oxidoreductase (luciferase family)